MSLFLGIDTSNYTTSTAIYDFDNNQVVQSKRLLPIKDGELGIRQSDAVFHHVMQLPKLYSELIGKIPCGYCPSDFTAVGVSIRPRSVEGSYMPCFNVGEAFANVIASTLNVPLFTFSHQEGHIAAALYSAKRLELLNEKFLAFHVSGGTTEAMLVTPDNELIIKAELVAHTLDLNAGQAVDRIGLMLGLCFPCGKELENLALKFDENIKVIPTLKGNDCCLSGVENICKKMLENGESKEKIAKFCLLYIEKTLEKMCENLLVQFGDMPVLFAGGVMSNVIVRKSFTEKFEGIFAEPEFSTDNAAGISVLAKIAHNK
ncbi:MAG: peptidase M22 [Bacillota bacterium]|nr:peptidase M22 [Bacillota bacterium]